MNHKRIHFILALVVATVAIILSVSTVAAARGNKESATPDAPQAPPATVAKPIVPTVELTETYPAEIEPVERVELRPRISGYLDSIHFDEGQNVARGQLLFRIDPRPYRAALAEAEAMLAQAQADAESAQREEERSARLLDRKAIAKETSDRRSATAQVSAARVAAANAAVQLARLNLEWTEVRSPINGRIGRAEVTRGNLVGPESRLGLIVSADPLYVRFDIDENRLAGLAGKTTGWSIGFLASGESTPRQAHLAFLENEIGRGTGTLRVRAVVENSDGALIPGMFGNAIVGFGERPEAMLIREEAIGANQGQRFVLVAGPDNVLQYRPVILGARHDDLRVITSGLQTDDRVVVNGLFRLRAGAPVSPNLVPMQQESSSAAKQNNGKES